MFGIFIKIYECLTLFNGHINNPARIGCLLYVPDIQNGYEKPTAY